MSTRKPSSRCGSVSSCGSNTSETYADYTSDETCDDELTRSTHRGERDHSLQGFRAVEDYLSRRNRRLEALKADRIRRQQQLQSSTSKNLGSGVLLCMEDHPYYLFQQEQKLQALKAISRRSSGDSEQLEKVRMVWRHQFQTICRLMKVICWKKLCETSCVLPTSLFIGNGYESNNRKSSKMAECY